MKSMSLKICLPIVFGFAMIAGAQDVASPTLCPTCNGRGRLTLFPRLLFDSVPVQAGHSTVTPASSRITAYW